MQKHPSENLLDYFVYDKDRQLPALHKTEAVKRALIMDSITNNEHPLNQLIEKKQTFLPFINERDSMGRSIQLLIVIYKQYENESKTKKDASSIFNSPKSSHHFLSKNQISNTSSLYDNQLPATRLKLKNLLGGTLKIQNQFNLLYQPIKKNLNNHSSSTPNIIKSPLDYIERTIIHKINYLNLQGKIRFLNQN